MAQRLHQTTGRVYPHRNCMRMEPSSTPAYSMAVCDWSGGPRQKKSAYELARAHKVMSTTTLFCLGRASFVVLRLNGSAGVWHILGHNQPPGHIQGRQNWRGGCIWVRGRQISDNRLVDPLCSRCGAVTAVGSFRKDNGCL